jgi:hypothetical protein
MVLLVEPSVLHGAIELLAGRHGRGDTRHTHAANGIAGTTATC